MIMIMKKMMILGIVFGMLFIFSPTILIEAKQESVIFEFNDGTKATQIIGDNLMDFGNKKPSYIYFGSYPKSEVKGDELTDEIINAQYSSKGIAIINGAEYKRVSVNEALYAYNFDWQNKPYAYFLVEPIKWKVLNVDNNKFFLLSEYGLNCRYYNDKRDNNDYYRRILDVTWKDSYAREWLNADFYLDAFSVNERKLIKKSTIENNDNLLAGTKGGSKTVDKVFLLSSEDVVNENYGFNSDEKSSDNNRCCIPTDFAKAMGVFENLYYQSISGNFFVKSLGCNWWLRSPGGTQNRAAYVNSYDWNVDSSWGREVIEKSAIRPAVNLDFSSVQNDTIFPEELRIDVSNITLSVGEKVSINAMVLPDNANEKKLSWKSSNPQVVDVSSKGVISANSVGNCKVTVSTSNGLKEVCTVKVVKKNDQVAVPTATPTPKAETQSSGINYDRDAAVKFAREAYDTNYQACTSLASCCLYKGGIPQKEKLAVKTTDSGSFGLKAKITTVGALYNFLINNDYAEVVEPSFVSSDEIKSNSKIQPGDIIMVKGGNTYYHNAVISSVETNSNGNIIVKLCQRNVSRKDKKLTKTWASSWNSNAKAYILHIKDDSKNSSSTDSKSNKVENIIKPAVGDKTLYYTDFTSKNYYYLEALDDISLRNGSSTSASKTGKKIKKGQKIVVSFIDKDTRYAWGKLSDGCYIIIADQKDDKYFKILNITKEQFPLGRYRALYDVAKKNAANINATKKGYYYPGDMVDIVDISVNGDYVWGKTTDGYWTALSEKQGELYYLYEGASDKSVTEKYILDEISNGSYKIVEDISNSVKSVEFEKVLSSAKKVTIPKSFKLDGVTYNVVSIAESAFKGDTTLTELIIEAEIMKLAASTFEDCIKLKEVHLPESLTTIAQNVFKNCEKLVRVDVPEGLKKVDESAFDGCKNIESVAENLVCVNDAISKVLLSTLLNKDLLIKKARTDLANMSADEIKYLNIIIQDDIQSQKSFEDKMRTALDYLVEIRGNMPWTANEKGCEPDDSRYVGDFEPEHPFYYQNENPELAKLPHCTNCNSANYIKSNWFVNLSNIMFGSDPIGDYQAKDYNNKIYGFSCKGGAITLQYLAYCAVIGKNTCLSGKKVEEGNSNSFAFTYNNVNKYCKIGDNLRIGGHSVIVYEINKDSITVVDVNTKDNIPEGIKYNRNCYMGKHTMTYNGKKEMIITRPKQYEDLS